MTTRPEIDERTPEAKLRASIGRFDAKAQKLMRAVRAAMRKRFPTANELAYDYGHSVVIAYAPSDRGIEGVVSIALQGDGVRLYLMNGPRLPDPKRLLRGTGKLVRFIPLSSARELAHADVKTLIAAAVDLASVPLPAKGKGSLIIKSEAKKMRPRRKATR